MADTFPRTALVGATQEQLEAMQETYLALAAGGTTVVEYEIGGRGVKKIITVPIGEMLMAITYALRIKNPALYGGAIVTRTQAGFGGYPQ